MSLADQLLTIGRRALLRERQRRCLSNTAQIARARLDLASGVADAALLGLSLDEIAALISALELAVRAHGDHALVGVTDLDDAASRLEEAGGHVGLALGLAEEAGLACAEAA